MYFPTGVSTRYDKESSLNEFNEKQALQTFKSKNGIQYAAYRDEHGNLRIAQMIEHANGNGKYAEELDTYSVMHGDIEKIKSQSKEDYSRVLVFQKEKSTGSRSENNGNDRL